MSMRRTFARIASLTSMVAVTCLASSVSAQTNDAATAHELFRVGQEEMKSGRWDAACTKFAEAQRLDPNVGYLVNLARCDEKRDHLADARESWLKALDLAKSRNDARLVDVQAGFDAIEKQVPRIVVRTSAAPPPGLVIERDDVTLTSASLGVPLPINPGAHVIGARAPGREKWTKQINVRAGDPVATIDVPELALSTAHSPSPPSDRSSTPAGAGADGSSGSTQRTLGIVAAGVGLAAAGVGTFFAIRASSLHDDSKQLCDPGDATSCSTDGVQLREDALGAADVATVAFVAAGVLIVGGAVLFFTAPSRTKPPATTFLGNGLVHRF